MSCRPPDLLVESLERLELISAAQWRAAGVLVDRRARARAARELARFDSVWLDALVQLRALTPYQAAAVRAGLADALRVGMHVIHDRVSWSRRAATYRARETSSGRWRLLAIFPPEPSARATAADAAPRGAGPRPDSRPVLRPAPHPDWMTTPIAALLGVPPRPVSRPDRILERLEQLAELHRRVEHPGLALVDQCGRDGATIWAAARWVEGRSLAEWLARRGRFPAPAVEEIVRQAATALAALHRAGWCHGEIDPSTIVLGRSGDVTLVLPGLHVAAVTETADSEADPVVESRHAAALGASCRPGALAARGETPVPTPGDDLRGLACAAWHALTGRPIPFGGRGASWRESAGSGSALPRVGGGSVDPWNRLRGDLSEGLSAFLALWIEPRPPRAAFSAAELAARLGPGEFDQRRALVASLAESGAGRGATPEWLTRLRGIAIAPRWVVGAWIALAAMALLVWWLVHRGDSAAPTAVVARTVSSGYAATATGAIDSHGTSVAPAASRAATGGALGDSAAGEPSRPPIPRVTGPTGLAAPSDSARTPGGERHGGERPETRGPSPVARVAEPTGPAAPSDSARTPGGTGPAPAGSDEIVLGASEPIAAASLPIRPGRTLRGAAGARPTILVDGSLVVDADGARFVELDFVWRGEPSTAAPRDPAAAQASPEAAPPGEFDAEEVTAAMIRLRAATAAFERCVFSATHAPRADAARDRAAPAAVLWENARGEPADPLALPGGRLRLADCVLHGLASGIRCRRDGARRIELDNVLAVDSGALVRLDRAAAADEPTLVRLSRVTLRGGGPLLECRHDELPDVPGRIAVEADSCAFAPAAGTALLGFRGAVSPLRWIERVEWLGSDSFLSDGAPMMVWIAPGAAGESAIDDAAIQVTGLVRSALGFAGAAGESVAASGVTRWQGPTRSTHPPGAQVDRLPPLPARRRGAAEALRHDTPAPPAGG